MIGLLLGAAWARTPAVEESWVRGQPDALEAAGLAFAEGRDGPWVRVVGPPGVARRFEGRPVVAAEGGYAPTPEAVEGALADLAAGSDGRAAVVDLGESVEGRPIVGLRVGEGSHAVRVLGGHHGDEGSSVVVALAVAAALVEDPTRVPADTEVWVVPAVNPDGLAAGTRFNADGVDLNRNYAYAWSADTPYAGPSAFSEPETRAMRALFRARTFLGGLSLHSGATNLGWPWNYTVAPRSVDEPLLAAIAAGYAARCTVPDFWVTNGADWYLTRGDTTDWTYGRWGALDYTLELTTEKTPPESLVETYVTDHLDAILALVALPPGVDAAVVDASTGEPVPGTLSGPDLAPTATGPAGVVARWYTGDPSALTVSAPGYADGVLGAPLRASATLHVRPEPPLLSRGDGPTRVTFAGFGTGALRLSQPGEADVVLPGEVEPDVWEIDPAALASGVWTVTGEAGVLPRALFVGEAADRVRIDEVEVGEGTVTLRGAGFGRGAEAWSLGGAARAWHPRTPLGGTSTTLVFDHDPADDDLVIWTNGAWLAAVGLHGTPTVDRGAPRDTGSPAEDDPDPPERTSSCEHAHSSTSALQIMLFVIFSHRRKKIQVNRPPHVGAPSGKGAPMAGNAEEGTRNALILRYLPMVRKVAYRMVSRFPSCVDVDDLVSIGMMGLIEAVDRFQHERSASFAAYARIRVQGAILDELRKNDWVPRSVRDRVDRIQNVRQELARDLGRAPTEAEVARTLGVSEERLREMIEDSTIRAVVSLEDGLDDEHAFGDLLASPEDTPDEELAHARTRQAIRACLDQLTPRERMVVDLYYFRDMNFKEIGETLGVTESRVSQIHTRMKERLEEHLASLASEAA